MDTPTNSLEEFKLLRDSITKKHDSQFITLGFTIAGVGSIMGLVVSSEKIKFCDVLYLLNFGMFILLASFIIVIRLVYSIRVIGGYIAKYLEPELFGGPGWESRITRLDAVSKKNTVFLTRGSHLTFIYLYLFMGCSIVLTLIAKAEDFNVYIGELSNINLVLFSSIFLLFISLILTASELHRKARLWKSSWNDIDPSPKENQKEQPVTADPVTNKNGKIQRNSV